jgi:hypothetical protein
MEEQMPEWFKTGAFVFICMLVWDIIRLFLQALVNKWMLSKDFERIEDRVEDVEDAIEEDDKNGN